MWIAEHARPSAGRASWGAVVEQNARRQTFFGQLPFERHGAALLQGLHYLLANAAPPRARLRVMIPNPSVAQALRKGTHKGAYERLRRIAGERALVDIDWRDDPEPRNSASLEAAEAAASGETGNAHASANDTVQAWTDGSWCPHSTIGGWAAVIHDGHTQTITSGAGPCANAQAAETAAILLALEHTAPATPLVIHTDVKILTGAKRTKGVRAAKAQIETASAGRDVTLRWARRKSWEEAVTADAAAGTARRNAERRAGATRRKRSAAHTDGAPETPCAPAPGAHRSPP